MVCDTRFRQKILYSVFLAALNYFHDSKDPNAVIFWLKQHNEHSCTCTFTVFFDYSIESEGSRFGTSWNFLLDCVIGVLFYL
jgi:hypothetical protein